MKNVLLLSFTLFVLSCGRRSGSSSNRSSLGPEADYSGFVSVTVVPPASDGLLAKAFDMTHAKLQILVDYNSAHRDTTFALSSGAAPAKLLSNVPVGSGVKVTANIFSQDDSLTHTGSALADIFAGETTAVVCSTQALFGYLQLKIIEVPQNVDSAYVKVAGAGMATLYAPLTVDGGDTANNFDGTVQGLIEYIRVGSNRKVEVFLLNGAGAAVYTGTATLNIGPGQNHLLTFDLIAQSAKLRVAVVESPYDTTTLVASPQSYAGPERGELIFSEIMYNPTGTDNNEWIEIYNTTASAINLSSYGLVIQTDTLLLTGSVPPLGFFVVGESDSAYVDQKMAGGISIPNSGATELLLFDASRPDTLSDHVSLKYETLYGWPSGSSISGISVELRRTALDAKSNNYGLFWAKATDTIPLSNPVEKGTPGY